MSILKLRCLHVEMTSNAHDVSAVISADAILFPKHYWKQKGTANKNAAALDIEASLVGKDMCVTKNLIIRSKHLQRA